jgi:hypothetical protein
MPFVISFHNEQPVESPVSFSQPMCPVCTGVLIELRGNLRCMRCHFCICADCEGGDVATGNADD